MKKRFRSASPRFFGTLFGIVVGCLALTVVHFFTPRTRLQYPFTRYLMLLHMMLVVLVPLVVSAALNILLILALKRNTMPIRMLNDSHVQQSLITARNKIERKVTLMVTVILTSFIVCNAPGAVVFLIKEGNETFNQDANHILLQTICNCLAVTGKVLNFLLFCLSSEHFRALLRKRLLSILTTCSARKARGNNYSSATKTFSVPLNEL
ncbi:unnamed protein product [Caenorhabditis auriculariae]|uniref:G-protein coupled receptors family 1 profile domain-containing protein n=1 Tax=Caenorhabditis auriculariae TaxID=2777116 RepID=A0A8S1HQ76_9PELO|nr:unnamed protein product [Caenorhabditis auriculariae]